MEFVAVTGEDQRIFAMLLPGDDNQAHA
jgi:hypothetical protein